MNQQKNVNQSSFIKPSILFILIILFIYPLPQMAIDVYLPSWPSMVTAFHTTKPFLQSTLTIYILFLGIAQLIYGPCSDAFGRKPTLLLGLCIFFIASIASIFSTSIHELLIFRAIQGLGMGAGFSVASAILADVFTGKPLAQMTTYSAITYSLSSILAPVLGGYLERYIGWKANFAAMALYGLILIIGLILFVQETNHNLEKEAIYPSHFIKNYFSILSEPRFIGNVVCLILTYGIMVTFSVVSPFLLQVELHVTPVVYGQLLLIVGLSYFIATTCNGFLLKKFNTPVLIFAGLILTLIAGVALFISSYINWFSPPSVILFTSMAIFGIGLVFPNCFANALDIHIQKGVSGAFIGSMILIGTALISFIVTHLHVHNEAMLSYIYLTLTVLSILAFLIVIKMQRICNKVNNK